MNRRALLIPVAAAAAAVLLASCATTDRNMTLQPAYDGKMVNDVKYMAAVETIAAGRGVDVQWINPPKVRKPSGE